MHLVYEVIPAQDAIRDGSFYERFDAQKAWYLKNRFEIHPTLRKGVGLTWPRLSCQPCQNTFGYRVRGEGL